MLTVDAYEAPLGFWMNVNAVHDDKEDTIPLLSLHWDERKWFYTGASSQSEIEELSAEGGRVLCQLRPSLHAMCDDCPV